MDGVILLDVSELEPPEPLTRTMAELQRLPEGHCLQMVHRFKPCLLYDNLAPLAILADTREGVGGRCEVFLWHRGDRIGEHCAREAAALLPPWPA